MKILVTGGASGLGAAIVNRLAIIENAEVYFTYARSVQQAEALKLQYPNVIPIHCDFFDENSILSLVGRIEDIEPDILINNAISGFVKNHFQKISTSVFSQSFITNILPTLQLTQSCIRVFRKNRFGKILTIASAALAGKPPIGWSEYVASKAYLVSMSKSWATENIRFNISSNIISPSFMMTSLNVDTDERVVEELTQTHPLKKLLTPNEVAEVVAFFCTCSQHINGINFIMNAGTDII